MSKVRNTGIYDFIEQMRQRPGMFTSDGSLGPIENLLLGYEAALSRHGIAEMHDGRPFTVSSFSTWLDETRGWSTNLGFSFAIENKTAQPAKYLDVFFDLVSEYRQSDIPTNKK